LKLFTNIECIEKEWEGIKIPAFLQTNFLKIYSQNHSQIKHLFVIDNNMRLYAHIFKLTFNKTKYYLKNNLLTNLILNFITFDVLYLTNSFITNVPSFVSDKLINLRQLLDTINQNHSLIVIPDFLFKQMIVQDNNYIRIEVEEEMILNLHDKWVKLEDYLADLKKKYRKKIRDIIRKTHSLEIRNLNVKDLKTYALEIQNLFNQVSTASRFEGPLFNTASFNSLVEEGFIKIDGYFLNNKLVGFSSTIERDQILYSYFVGFDKNINKSLPIYGRILTENIDAAIKLKKKCLILGRTANEYKSNFGAIPIKSYVHLKVENKILRIILHPIINKLRIAKWKQRNPFKNRII
tara:strand:- start:13512 stop:14561 length:1050 start_codon:yes stop_codon:yes gene_type:complete